MTAPWTLPASAVVALPCAQHDGVADADWLAFLSQATARPASPTPATITATPNAATAPHNSTLRFIVRSLLKVL